MMVDCYDRLQLQLSEVVLRPLKRLQLDAGCQRVTVRPPGRGCRVDVTISRQDDAGKAPQFAWSACEVDGGGNRLESGRSWIGERPCATPEAAYWAAVQVISSQRMQPG